MSSGMHLTGNKDPYFLGSFIFNFEHTEQTGFVEVVDGQQRILTLMIFSQHYEIAPSLLMSSLLN